MELKPITRQEKIIAGQDLTPITRMEKFLKQFGGGGGGLPTGGAPYQQLVTDGEGNAKWEDRLAYENVAVTEIVPEETVAFSAAESFMNAFWPPVFDPVLGEKYTIKFDGVEYSCECIISNGVMMLGNLSIVSLGADTGEPFIMMFQMPWSIITSDTASEHTISISGITTHITPVPEKFLPVVTNGLVFQSSTEGSTKKFRITVDDSGTISAAEVTT